MSHKLSPPPTIVKLIDDIGRNSIWVTWLNNLTNYINETIGDQVSDLKKTLFGNQLVANLKPVIQEKFVYFINPGTWRLQVNSGSISIDAHRLKLSVSNAANTSCGMLTRSAINYHSGVSNIINFDCAFNAGLVGSNQLAGVGDISDGFAFGYKDDKFGAYVISYGHSDYQRLNIIAGATSAGSAAVTIDGATIGVTVTNSGDATITANEIAKNFNYSSIKRGWRASANGSDVLFISFRAEASTGAFSISGQGITGNFANILTGVSPNIVFDEQANWVGDKIPALDPQLLNNYQIRYQWGRGVVEYYIQDPVTTNFLKVHTISNINNSLLPMINNPVLPLVYFAENTTNTTALNMYSTNISGFNEGNVSPGGHEHSVAIGRSISGTSFVPLITLHSPELFKGVPNRAESKILVLSIAVDGIKDHIIQIVKSTELTGASFSQVDDHSPLIFDTQATLASGGDVLVTFVMAKASDKFLKTDFKISPGDQISVLIDPNGNSDVLVSLSFEDFQ